MTPRRGERPAGGRVRAAMTLALCGALAALALLPAAAMAGGPGVWTDITGPTGTNLTQTSLVRAADGTLWASYVTGAPGPRQLSARPISSAGVAGSPVAVLSGQTSLNNPAILLRGAGLTVFYSGPGNALHYADSPTGTAWTVSANVLDPTGVAYASDIAACVASSGTTFQTWNGTYGVFVHRGETAGTAYNYMTPLGAGATGYYSNLSAQANGTVWLAWAVLDSSRTGLYVQQVDPTTGAPAGSYVRLADSVTTYNGTPSFSIGNSLVPIVSRAAGGTYVAYETGYPTTTRVTLWEVSGSSAPVTVAGSSTEKKNVCLVVDPGGRIWVFWTESAGGRADVFARRSNLSATAWSPIVSVKGPAGASTAYHMAGNAQAGALDVLVHYDVNGTLATYHTQVLAPLSVKVKPASLKVGRKATVTVTVTDAGDPVAGAKVKFGSKTVPTAASGKAKVKVGPYRSAKKLRFTVSKSGYSGATVPFVVKK